MSPIEQLALAETVLRLVREEMPSYASASDDEQRLAQAAEALREEYLTNKELTVFTVLGSTGSGGTAKRVTLSEAKGLHVGMLRYAQHDRVRVSR